MKSLEEGKKPIFIFNYGCSANRAIAEGLTGMLKRHGYLLANSKEEAEVVIVNTCIVKQNTEHRMKSELLSLSKTKDIIITGCLPVVMRDWVLKNLPFAKVIFPDVTNQIIDLLQERPIIQSKITNPSIWSQMYDEGRFHYNPTIAIVEISRGCMGSCTFCIVKNVKGNIRSRSQESILREIRNALDKGCKEVWLTSQDTGSYGWDFSPKIFIPNLIDSITRLKGRFFIRLGMMTPITLNQFSSSLISQLQEPKVFSFLHLPVQSGSDQILRKMRRKETRIYFIDLLNSLREKVSDLVLATDVMVGFPGESEKDFIYTKDLIKEVRPIIVNLSKYTDRPGTLASKMQPKIPSKIKANRSREFSKLIRTTTQRELRKWIGWKGVALIDEFGKKPNQFIGRNTSYLPVLLENENLKLGEFIETRITGTGPTYLIGEKK